MEVRKVTYADMIATWQGLLFSLLAYTSCALGVAVFVADNSDSLTTWVAVFTLDTVGVLVKYLIGMAGLVAACWSPGLLVAMYSGGACSRLAKTSPAYINPRRILANRFCTICRIVRRGFDHWGASAAFSVMTTSAVAIIVLPILGIVLQEDCMLGLAVGVGMNLSWGGAMIVLLILARDTIRSRRAR